MRVALLSFNAQAGDAIGNHLVEKLQFFRDSAADVRVFLESDCRLHPALPPFVQVVPCPEPRGEWWRFVRSADLVCAEFGHFYSLLSLLPLLSGGKPRIVLDYHGVTPPELWGGHNREGLVQGLRHRGLAWCADATLTHSRFTQDELLAFTGLPRQRLPRLGYVLDTGLFTPGAAGHNWRQSLGLERARILLFVGRLAPNKRPVLLVEALQHLGDLPSPVHAVFVGDARDLYQAEAQRCLDRARELGLADRVHLVGSKVGSQLRDYYRAADVFVMPSLWESFCIPVIEAMACGLPVVAARASCLPETVASAGLTFTPDDAVDLSRQVRRLLTSQAPVHQPAPPALAVVACRYGTGFASGAEASLRRLALTLKDAGCAVEVFTTCTSSENGAANDLPGGTTVDDGLAVHRFPVDPPAEPIQGNTPRHPIHSQALLEALAARADAFDAILAGPYLAGLTTDVVGRWPAKTMLVPSFHDEPVARLACWQPLYEGVAGILYHSPEEQSFAERVLGLNHPAAAVVGTHLEPTAGDAARGRSAAGAERWVVYSGRYAADKNLPLLLDWARHFQEEHPGRLCFVFTGQGGVAIPDEPWAVDLGFVADDLHRDVLAGAVALVQLSCNESLSLAALEAWAQRTPVVAQRQCAVLAGHIERSGGGLLVETYEEFAAALLTLLDQPEVREQLGQGGQRYVCQRYGSATAFRDGLLAALEQSRRPLAQQMQARGLERAATSDRRHWRQQFGAIVDNVLHAGPRDVREHLRVLPRSTGCAARLGTESILVAVRVVNRGSELAVAEGPARTVVSGAVIDAEGTVVRELDPPTPLPAVLMPGRAVPASVAIPVPDAPGNYRIHLWTSRADRADADPLQATTLPLVVAADKHVSPREGCTAIIDEAQAALVEANRVQRLPDDYTDVTEGRFAGLKRRIKQKLLGNFKKAYVDVLSRQQSACNQHLVEAVQALTECCATLDHTVGVLQERLARLESEMMVRERRPLRDAPTKIGEPAA
jgi:glycosyltransferase involved in cell wall biosynthesis